MSTTVNDATVKKKTATAARGLKRYRQQPEHAANPLFHALCQAEENEDDRISSLIIAARRLSNELARIANVLTKNPKASINPLGVIQNSGLEIDRLCGEIDQARKATRTLTELWKTSQQEQS
jgi:hypothetical protein